MHTSTSFIISGLISGLLTLSTPAQNLLTNGDFESWASGKPSSWNKETGTIITEVAGLDGTGSAVQLSSDGNDNGKKESLRQEFDDLSDMFLVEFDFRLLTTGNSKNGDRSLNFTVRNTTTTSSDPIITGRSLYDGVNDGTLQFYDGGAWVSITGQTEDFNTTDVYRLTLNGSLNSASYDVSLFNVTDGVSAGGQTGITNFQTAPGSNVLNTIRFERGRSDVDYIVDNVAVTVIPEPSTFILMLGALGACVVLRRKTDAH